MVLDFSVKEQLFCCLVCLAVGAVFGIMYDAVRVIYMILCIDPHDKKARKVISNVPVFFIDLAFMSVVSIIYAVIMYVFAYGKFRIVFGICSVAGFVVYNRTLSRAVMLFFHWLIAVIRSALRFVFRILLYPVKLTSKYIGIFVIMLYSVTLKKIILKIKLKLDIIRFNRTVSESFDRLIRFDDV